MIYRKLGKTGLDVGIIGLGTEYLIEVPKETVVSVVDKAIDTGINYFDLPFALPHYRDNFGYSLRGKREKVIIAGHLGCIETDGQYQKSRNKNVSDKFFHDLLVRLNTDYVDILMIHSVNSDKLPELDDNGLMELAVKYKEQGKARFIGMSSHLVPAALGAVERNLIDVLMFPVNIKRDSASEKNVLLSACLKNNIGLVAMKVFAGGGLLQEKKSLTITPIHCIGYALSQPAISCSVPGVRNVSELNEALRYLSATDAEKDFSHLVKYFRKDIAGECVYCNHCLPCPVKIDIGSILRIANQIHNVSTECMDMEYSKLQVKASACNECGICMKRCFFDVDVICMMRKAAKAFES